MIARAGCAADGAELRHRPAGDGRACALARRQLAGADLACSRTPACRNWSTATRTIRWAPAELATWVERFVARGRRQPDRRLLRHLDRRISRRWTRCCAGAAGSARRRCARTPVWVPARRQPVSGGAAAAGERYLRHRRALQRQRLEEMARTAGDVRLGRLRRHGPRADRRRLATRSTSAPPSSAATKLPR